MREPQIHSHITDGLAADHRLHQKGQTEELDGVFCDTCEAMLHCHAVNECMQLWVETGIGNFCLPCFTKQVEMFGEAAMALLDESEASIA